jgi:hypothetical protein
VPGVYFYVGPSFGLLSNLVPPQMRATALAILLLASNIANLVIAPRAVGFVSDHLAGAGGANAASLRIAPAAPRPHRFLGRVALLGRRTPLRRSETRRTMDGRLRSLFRNAPFPKDRNGNKIEHFNLSRLLLRRVDRTITKQLSGGVR